MCQGFLIVSPLSGSACMITLLEEDHVETMVPLNAFIMISRHFPNIDSSQTVGMIARLEIELYLPSILLYIAYFHNPPTPCQ